MLDLRNNRTGPVIRGLMAYIGAECPNPCDWYQRVWGNSLTASNLVMKVGQYKTAFKNEHYALMDNRLFRGVLAELGYEW